MIKISDALWRLEGKPGSSRRGTRMGMGGGGRGDIPGVAGDDPGAMSLYADEFEAAENYTGPSVDELID